MSWARDARRSLRVRGSERAPRRDHVAGFRSCDRTGGDVGATSGRSGSSWRLVIVSLAALCLAPAECGLESGTKDVGAPCTRDGECLLGLQCVRGVCSDGRDADVPDAGDAG